MIAIAPAMTRRIVCRGCLTDFPYVDTGSKARRNPLAVWYCPTCQDAKGHPTLADIELRDGYGIRDLVALVGTDQRRAAQARDIVQRWRRTGTRLRHAVAYAVFRLQESSR